MFDVIAESPAARQTLVEANAAAGFDVVAAARGSTDIFRNTAAQPLICAYQLATWSALAPLLPTPALFAGYSVGELAAYGCAGSLSAFDTVRLARARAALMDEESREPAGLLALRGLTRGKVDSLCAKWRAEIAIVNGEEHFVVGGPAAVLGGLAAQATALGASTQRLPVEIAAHTSLVVAAGTRFREILECASFKDPATPVLGSVNADLVQDRQSAIGALSQQISRTVLWSACLDSAYERGCRVFLELGSCNALARMTRDRFPEVAARSVSEFRNVDAVADWVARSLD